MNRFHVAMIASLLIVLSAWASPWSPATRKSEFQEPSSLTFGECSIDPRFFVPGPDRPIRDAVVWDDGSGPALYVAGEFRTIGSVDAAYVARWDGSNWSRLEGADGFGTNGPVHALAVHDDGGGEDLYVGGDFSEAGGNSALHVARWDGAEWSPLGTAGSNGVNDIVHSLVSHDDGGGLGLFLGGDFTAAAGAVSASHVVQWDGSGWSQLVGTFSDGTDGRVRDLEVWDDGGGSDLYAAGDFDTAGGLAANGIARWDGTSWAWVEGTGGTSPRPEGDIGLWDGGLVVGDDLDIFHWDGTDWTELVSPDDADDVVPDQRFLSWDDGTGPKLYAGTTGSLGGEFTMIAQWDGSKWTKVGSDGLDDQFGYFNNSAPSGGAGAMTVFDDGGGEQLYVLGGFRLADNQYARAAARWDGTAWSALPQSQGLAPTQLDDPEIMDVVLWDDGTGPALYFAGRFSHLGTTRVNHVARWDGETWQALIGSSGNGVNDVATSLEVFGDSLYVSGAFDRAGGLLADRYARWDGNEWSPVLGGSSSPPEDGSHAMEVFDDGSGVKLFVSAGATWDGSEWQSLPQTSPGIPYALAEYDSGSGPALVFAGLADYVVPDGYEPVIVQWVDQSFELVDPDPDEPEGVFKITDLQVADLGDGEKLYASTNSSPLGTVLVWDGTSWSGLSGGSPDDTPAPGCDGVSEPPVTGLTVFDDGTGDALYAVGCFETIDGDPIHGLARWDGTDWESVLDAVVDSAYLWEGTVFSIHAVDFAGAERLFLSGEFVKLGDTVSYQFGSLVCPAAGIFADGFESGDTSIWSQTVSP